LLLRSDPLSAGAATIQYIIILPVFLAVVFTIILIQQFKKKTK
jgi:hypothetical protein